MTTLGIFVKIFKITSYITTDLFNNPGHKNMLKAAKLIKNRIKT